MKISPRKPRLLTIALITLGSLAGGANAAVTISITGDPNSTTATVSLSGTLTLIDQLGAGLTTPEVSVPTSSIGNRAGSLGLNGNGATSPSAFRLSQFNPDAYEGSGADTATVTITDSSNNNAVISTGGINRLTFGSQGFFTLHTSSSVFYPVSIDAGDILTLDGSFDLDFGGPGNEFRFFFNEGSFSGDYEGQAVNVVVTSIPEPSSSILLALAGICVFNRRKR